MDRGQIVPEGLLTEMAIGETDRLDVEALLDQLGRLVQFARVRQHLAQICEGGEGHRMVSAHVGIGLGVGDERTELLYGTHQIAPGAAGQRQLVSGSDHETMGGAQRDRTHLDRRLENRGGFLEAAGLVENDAEIRAREHDVGMGFSLHRDAATQ